MKLAAAALAVLLVSGCAGSPDEPLAFEGRPNVEVDSSELRELKAQAGVEPCEPGSGAPVDGGLPELELACFGGGDPVDLSSLRGPLVINLWASWCSPCRKEMPVLQDFHEQYGDTVPTLGVAWQDVQTTAAMELVVSTGVTYPLLADPAGDWGVIDGMPVRGLPGIVLVARDGTIAYRNLEVIDSVDQLVGLVEEHLGERL